MNAEYNIKIKHSDEDIRTKIDKREAPKDCSALVNSFNGFLKNYRGYLSDEDTSKLIAMILRIKDHKNRLPVQQHNTMRNNLKKMEKHVAKILGVPMSKIHS